jgi:phospholipase C
MRWRWLSGIAIALIAMVMAMPECHASTPEATTTTLGSSLNPSVYGQAVTFTATVSSLSGTPAGTISFIKNGTVMGAGTLFGGVATFTTTATTFAVVGTRAMTAAYAGNADFSASTSPALSQVVTQAPSSIALASSLNPSIYGQAVTFTATVASLSGTPVGTVTFFRNGAVMGTGTLSGGVAIFTTTAATFAVAGAKSIRAEYAGDTNFSAAASATLNQVVSQAPSSIALSSSVNPSVYGQPVTFTATVTSLAPMPTGTVTFYMGSEWIGDAILTDGVGTFVTTGLSVGTASVTAVYGGRGTNFGSVSPALNQVVTPATSTVTLTSSPNPSAIGQSVALTAYVIPEFSGTPAGTITFTSGSTTLGTATLRGRTASLSSSALTAGTLAITARYLSTNGFSAGLGALTQKVNPSGTPGYALTAAALKPGSVTAGNTSTSIITLTPANSYAGTVNLSCGKGGGRMLVPGCSFNPSSLIINGGATTSVLTASTSSTTPAGSYAILVTGSDTHGLTPVNGPQTLAMTTATVIEHIVIIFQENRSPDNLFQDPVLIARGADIASTATGSQGQTIPLTPVDLGSVGANPSNYDPDHDHNAFVAMYDGGKMDGANPGCSPDVFCPPVMNRNFEYRYVDPADVQPYFALAEQYTFGDRMFQTNQGPSFPAHQFILAGTSAPTATSPLFAAENPYDWGGGNGCFAPPATLVTMIDAAGSERDTPPQYPCYEHATLTDLLNARALTWRYYTPIAGGIWTAPDAIGHMCQQQTIDGTLTCTGPDWTNNVIVSQTQVLEDIVNGQLAQVSWVIPTGLASDHAGTSDGSGPSWVASIVNAIGNGAYWANTAIIITWDDWGGWYDHVAPKVIDDGVSWGSGYVYGFRVPLIVVSPYAKAAYISHATHDFGSILKFIESNFDLPSLGYADAYADDLSDCFNLTQTPLTFQTIPAPLSAAFFLNDKRPPTAPDDD